jgi:hypothetical protein
MFADSDDEKKQAPNAAAGPECNAATAPNDASVPADAAEPTATAASTHEDKHATPTVAPAAGTLSTKTGCTSAVPLERTRLSCHSWRAPSVFH